MKGGQNSNLRDGASEGEAVGLSGQRQGRVSRLTRWPGGSLRGWGQEGEEGGQPVPGSRALPDDGDMAGAQAGVAWEPGTPGPRGADGHVFPMPASPPPAQPSFHPGSPRPPPHF